MERDRLKSHGEVRIAVSAETLKDPAILAAVVALVRLLNEYEEPDRD